VIEQTPPHLGQFGGQGALVDLKPRLARDRLDTSDDSHGGRQGRARGEAAWPAVQPLLPHHLLQSQTPARAGAGDVRAHLALGTWDDLLNTARRQTREVGDPRQWGFPASHRQGVQPIVPGIWGNGGEGLNADERTCLLDCTPAMDAVPRWFGLPAPWQAAPTREARLKGAGMHWARLPATWQAAPTHEINDMLKRPPA
jgi:hypothetical protein